MTSGPLESEGDGEDGVVDGYGGGGWYDCCGTLKLEFRRKSSVSSGSSSGS